jgi:hypothetical protein
MRAAAKLHGSELGHSSPSAAELENEWSCDSAPPICLHGIDSDSFMSVEAGARPA